MGGGGHDGAQFVRRSNVSDVVVSAGTRLVFLGTCGRGCPAELQSLPGDRQGGWQKSAAGDAWHDKQGNWNSAVEHLRSIPEHKSTTQSLLYSNPWSARATSGERMEGLNALNLDCHNLSKSLSLSQVS